MLYVWWDDLRTPEAMAAQTLRSPGTTATVARRENWRAGVLIPVTQQDIIAILPPSLPFGDIGALNAIVTDIAGVRWVLPEGAETCRFVFAWQQIVTGVLPDSAGYDVYCTECLARVIVPGSNTTIEPFNRDGTGCVQILMAKYGQWVTDIAILSAFVQSIAGRAGPFSVNLAPDTIIHPEFFNIFTGLLQEYWVDSSQIVIEVLEYATSDIHQLRTACQNLRWLGIGIAIDDFDPNRANGNNMATLEALSVGDTQEAEAITTIKYDGWPLVQLYAACTDTNHDRYGDREQILAAFVDTIVRAHTLHPNARIVFERVENAAVLAFLTDTVISMAEEHGVPSSIFVFQGYYFHKAGDPISANSNVFDPIHVSVSDQSSSQYARAA